MLICVDRGLLFSKKFFWFGDEASTAENLTNFMRTEKADTKHHDAAWARETGKGLLFYTKRAEDKGTPSGVINLVGHSFSLKRSFVLTLTQSEATLVTKEGVNHFSFKVGTHQHRFEAATSQERDSWVVAVEKIVEETKGLKEDLTSRGTYKKNFEEYCKFTSLREQNLGST